MKDFAEIVGGTAGHGKTQEEIRATTGRIQHPEDWKPNQQLPEWERAETLLRRDEFIRRCEPTLDRILVQVLPRGEQLIIQNQYTTKTSLIGGECRKAIVLKTGPGRWIPGEWWKLASRLFDGMRSWQWIPGYRRPVSVFAGQAVLIGHWTDLELEDIALCSELDVRAIVQ